MVRKKYGRHWWEVTFDTAGNIAKARPSPTIKKVKKRKDIGLIYDDKYGLY